ncbi:hypothetical protein [Ekhidna sp.]|uniref:hypothetical protein n=1 Tax=Ekhidna sp. TaxID=2608089 RepID=UPI003CCBFE00
MFTLLIILVFVLNSLDIESELIIIPTFFFISVYPVIALRIQHWSWSILKGVIAVIIPFLISSAFMINMLDNLIINLIQNEEVLEMKPSNELVIKVDALEFEPGRIQQVTMIDHKNFIILGENNISWFKNQEISASIPLTDYHSKKMMLLSDRGPLLVVCYHEHDGVLEQGIMTLYSMKGDTLWNKRINASNQQKSLSFTLSDRDKYSIFSLGNRVSLSKTNNKWVGDIEVLPTSHVLTEFQSTDSGDIRIITKKGNHHIISYSLEFVGISDTVQWKRDIYTKSGPFDPLDELTVSYDSLNQTIYTHYTLANDSTYEAYLNAIDIKTGHLNWSNSITIPAHVTEYEGLTFDYDYLYLYGEGHKFYSEWFWQPTYHIGLLVKVDKKTGMKMNHIFLGPNENWDAHSHIYGVTSIKDSLFLLTYDEPKESILGEDTDEILLKKLPRNF